MTYQQTLNYILKKLPMYQRIGKSAYREGLDNTILMDDYFNQPHLYFKSVHVAGTNGKGSVSHMLASVLQEAGLKTGLYTSPHLVDFRERIKVNGQMISKKYVTEFIQKHKVFFETFDPSFFEISVFMAFEYFKSCHIDIAVVEVGLGGRLDATNIISPVLSVITNIGMDHTEILGKTLEKIAAEKAGIIKRNIPVIIGESRNETLPVFAEHCKRNNSKMTIADQQYRIDYSLKSFDGYQVFNARKNDEVAFANLKCGLLGHYQRKNTVTVLAALDEIANTKNNPIVSFSEKDIYAGIKNVVKNTGLSGRWQTIRQNPAVICDTAHNADGIRLIVQQLNETAYKHLHMIIGFVNDKDVERILKYLPAKATYYFTRLSVPRTMDEDLLTSLANKQRLKGKAYEGITQAYSAAKGNAGHDDIILITGSNFLVADFFTTSGKGD